ncbi:MAG: hypothetical protein K6F86_09045 [Lachnospiraceae bacterium]|nr:hypothetical protein [Lachnospiraceae bacterium]
MLYNEKIEKEILLDAFDYVNRTMKDAKLIFSSMVGSISQGGHYFDSDYDTRFLYIRDSFPSKTILACEHNEDELVKRYYPQNKVYEWIPFWELTSFFSFWDNPKFLDCDISLGLYNIVDWTINSPYVWDPYGLQQKIVPIMHRIFVPENKMCAQKKIIEKYYGEIHTGNQVIVKSYFYMIHAAATIEFINRYRTMAPVDIQSLLFSLNRMEIYSFLENEMTIARKKVRDYYEVNESIQLQGQHFKIKMDRCHCFDNYIKEQYSIVSGIEPIIKDDKKIRDTIENIFCIIEHSVYNTENLGFAR